MNVTPQVKPHPFAWSYSKLKNYETCARRYSEVDLKKSVEEVKSQELARGDALHNAMYSRVLSDVALPPEFIYMEKWAEKLTRNIHPLQIIQCELKLAVDKLGAPVGFFERSVWLRGKIDYFRIIPSATKGRFIAHVVDYKTGKPKEDYTQLLLSAQLIFCHYRDVQELRSDFLWTEYNDTMHENFKREDMPALMAQVTPRVTRMELAHIEGKFPPNPCGLCYQYCPVTTCEHYGTRVRRAQ